MGTDGGLKAPTWQDPAPIRLGWLTCRPGDIILQTPGVDRVFSKNVTVYFQYAGLSYGDLADDWTLGWNNGFGGSVSGAWKEDGYQNPSGFSVGAFVNF